MTDDAASDSWYYEHAGVRRGPVPIDVLRDLLETGVVASTALVWNGNNPHGTPAQAEPRLCFLEDIDLILSGPQPLPAKASTDAAIIRLTCRCGKRLKVPRDALGRRVRCPRCGEGFAAVPSSAIEAKPVPPRTDRRPALSDSSSHQSLSVIPWLTVAVFVAACAGFVAWLLTPVEPKLTNEAVPQAIADAEAWLALETGAERQDGESLAAALEAELKSADAANKNVGDAVMQRLRLRLDSMKVATGNKHSVPKDERAAAVAKDSRREEEPAVDQKGNSNDLANPPPVDEAKQEAGNAGPADVRNARWGDDPDTCMKSAQEKLVETTTPGSPEGPARIRVLGGEVAIDDEPLEIRYIFFDNQLVEVVLEAMYSNRMKPAQRRRDDRWNPYATQSKIGVLLHAKYGMYSDQEAFHDGSRIGLLRWKEWADNMPYSGNCRAAEIWDLPRHRIKLEAGTWRQGDLDFRNFNVSYRAKTPHAELFEKYSVDQRKKGEVQQRQDNLKRAQGL